MPSLAEPYKTEEVYNSIGAIGRDLVDVCAGNHTPSQTRRSQIINGDATILITDYQFRLPKF
jgi:hypothetical protein